MDISSNEVTDDLVSACKEHSSRIAIDGEGVSVSYGNLLAEATPSRPETPRVGCR